MTIIEENPYRLFGVFANSPIKKRVANYAKIKAFLKVGKQVSFPLDLSSYMSPVERTLEKVVQADTTLTFPVEKVKYAQFWFLNVTPLDNLAFKHIFMGRIKEATKIWAKKDNVSSLQNRIICALIMNDYGTACEFAQTLYNTYSAEFLSIIGCESTGKTFEDLAFSFLDVLLEVVEAKNIMPNISNKKWGDYIEEKNISPILKKLHTIVDAAIATRGQSGCKRLLVGIYLRKDVKKLLPQLQQYLSFTDLRYQMIADKAGLEILQCGIDSFNTSVDVGRARGLLSYAQSIVVGRMAKGRCDENVRMISKLPPPEVMPAHRTIQSYLNKFENQPDLIKYSIQLMKDCAPYIVAIKEDLGVRDSYYLKISTEVVNNALCNIISEVNEAQEKDFETLKTTLIEAWHAQLYMDKFDLEPEYKEERYKQCREALHEIISNCKGFVDSSMSFMYQYGCGWCNDLNVEDLDLRTDDDFYISCHDIPSLRNYVKEFPSGKHISEAESQIEALAFQNANTIADLGDFIQQYPLSQFVPQAKSKITELRFKECKTIADFKKFINDFPNSNLVCKAQDAMNSIIQEEKEMQARVARQEYAKKRDKIIKWSLPLIILIGIVFTVFLIWGYYGLSIVCYTFACIFGLLAFAGFCIQDGMGCLLAIVAGSIAWGLTNLGNHLNDIYEEEIYGPYVKTSTQENPSSYSSDNDSYSTTESNEEYSTESETSQDDIDYNTYIDNQLATGAKPYKNYYPSHTGKNYLDFKTSGNDYVIIVRNYSTSDVVNHIYVRAGDKGRLYLPNGTYNIYFYGGKGWNPNMENGNVVGGFVSGGDIQKDGPVKLYNQYGEYTLYPVQNGNLQLREATKSEAL